jgi:hypothetical protein
MRYSVCALAPDERVIDLMYQKLLGLGAPAGAISTRPGQSGNALPSITVKTSDLKASESYRETLERAGGTVVTSSEESSALNAIR